MNRFFKAIAAAAMVTSLTAAADTVPVNKIALANILATNNDNNTVIYKVAPANGSSTVGNTYIQDPANHAQYVAGGYGADDNGGSAGVGSGTVVVQDFTDAHGTTRNGAIVMTTSEGPADGALYFDTGPNPLVAAHNITLSFSIDLIQNGGIADPTDINGAAFAANIFAESTSATRFIAAPTSDSGGVFGLTRSDGSLQTVGTYNNNTFYDISLNLNFGSQTVTMGIDGVNSGPFAFRNTITGVNGDAPRLTEAFFYQDTYATPLPSAQYAGLALFACIGLGGGIRRWRRTVA